MPIQCRKDTDFSKKFRIFVYILTTIKHETSYVAPSGYHMCMSHYKSTNRHYSLRFGQQHAIFLPTDEAATHLPYGLGTLF